MEHAVGVTIPIFWGQGVIIPFGFLPKRSPINTVVGAPISVPRYSQCSHLLLGIFRQAFATGLSLRQSRSPAFVQLTVGYYSCPCSVATSGHAWCHREHHV